MANLFPLSLYKGSIISQIFQPMFEHPEEYQYFRPSNFESYRKEKKEYFFDKLGYKDKFENLEKKIRSTRKGENDKIIEYFQNKMMDSFQEEKFLFEENKDRILNQKNKIFNLKPPTKLSDDGKEFKEIIKFWTFVFSGIFSENESKKMDKNSWIQAVVGSQELAQAMKSQESFSLFSRQQYLKAKKSVKKGKERTASGVEETFESYFQNELKKGEAFSNLLKNRGILEDITNAFMSEIPILDQKKSSFKKRFLEIAVTKIKRKKEVTFKHIKDALKETGEQMLKEIEEYTLKNYPEESPVKEINVSNNGVCYLKFVISGKSGKKGYYDTFRENYDTQIEAFLESLKKFIYTKELGNPKNSVSLTEFNKGQKITIYGRADADQIIEKDFKEKEGTIKNLLEMTSKKKLNTVSIIGVLGEYRSTFTKNLDSFESQGYKSDYVEIEGEKKNLGESFSDMKGEMNGKEFGFNIKHYVSDLSKNSITLYSPQSETGINFFTTAIYRYFSTDEVKLLRFVDANYQIYSYFATQIGEGNTISDLNIENAYYNISLNNLSNFVRITSSVTTEFSNMFFIINNMYIPTSYIYKVIVDYLKVEKKNKENNERSFFKIFLSTSKEKEISNSLINDPKEACNIVQEQLLNNIKPKEMSRILFKGLRINDLKSLIKI